MSRIFFAFGFSRASKNGSSNRRTSPWSSASLPKGAGPVRERLFVTNPAKRTVIVTVRNARNPSTTNR